jgi:Hypoxia induced protein conserved region
MIGKASGQGEPVLPKIAKIGGALGKRPPQAYIQVLGAAALPWACEAQENRLQGQVMNILTVLLLLAMCATLGVLIVGLVGFFQGGEFNRKYGNKLMRARVALQALAVLLLLAVLVTAG